MKHVLWKCNDLLTFYWSIKILEVLWPTQASNKLGFVGQNAAVNGDKKGKTGFFLKFIQLQCYYAVKYKEVFSQSRADFPQLFHSSFSIKCSQQWTTRIFENPIANELLMGSRATFNSSLSQLLLCGVAMQIAKDRWRWGSPNLIKESHF